MRVKMSQIALKHRRFLSTFVGLSALLFMSSACQFGGSFEEARCSSESDCDGEAICVEGFCALPHTDQPSSPDVGEDVEDFDGGSDVGEDIIEDADSEGDPDADVVETPVVDRISVDPVALSLQVGELRAITATAFDTNDEVMAGIGADNFRWNSDDPSIVVPVGGGQVRALSVGETQITVTYEGVSATVAVEVSPASAGEIEIFPATITLSEGGSYQADARAYDLNGALIRNPDIV